MSFSVNRIPFNFQPADVQYKTGSFTIPAGQYAQIISYNDLEIDPPGATAAFLVQQGSATSGVVTSNTTLYTANGEQKLYVAIRTGSGCTAGINDGTNDINLLQADSNFSGEIVLADGDTIEGFSGGNNVAFYIVEKTTTEPIWVPSGTILDGNSYTFVLFNEIA